MRYFFIRFVQRLVVDGTMVAPGHWEALSVQIGTDCAKRADG